MIFFMKTLYFIRHAKSSWKDPLLKDFDRPLNSRGKRDAPFMAQRLKHFNVKPDLILASPALRAKKTAQIIAKTLECEITFEPRLYESTIQTYIKILGELHKDINSLFIIAHNPEITLVCEWLTDAILGNIPTSGIVGIEFDLDTLEQLEEGSGKMLFFDYPKKHIQA